MFTTPFKRKTTTSSKASTSNQDILTAAKGGGISFTGQIFASAAKFIFGVLVARFLGAEQYGLYTLGLTVVTLMAGFALLGLGSGLVRFVSIALRDKNETRLWGVMQVGIGLPSLISILFGGLVFILAEPIATQMFDNPQMIPVLRAFSVVIPLSVVSTMLTSVTEGFKQIQHQVYSQNIGLHVVKLVLAGILLALGFGLMGVVFAYVIGAAIATAMLVYFVHGLFPLNRRPHVVKEDAGELMRFSLPLYLSSLLNKFGNNFESLILGLLGLTTGVGIYAAIDRLSGVGQMFYGAVRTASTPIIADLYHQRKFKELEKLYQTTTKWAITFNLPIFLGTIFFAGPLLSIFGKEFTVGVSALIILSLGGLLNAATGLCGSVISMSGRSKLSLANSVAYLLATIIFDLLLIPRWEVLGAALAGALTIVFVNLLRLIEVYYLHRMLPFNWSFVKPLAAGAIAAGATYMSSQWLMFNPMLLSTILNVLILGTVYAIMLLLLGFSEEDRAVLDRLWKRFRAKRLRR